MTSRRLRRLRAHSCWAHRRIVQSRCHKQRNTGGKNANGARGTTRLGKRAKAGTKEDALHAAAIEEELRQLRALDARGTLSSTSSEDDAEDEEGYEDEDVLASEVSGEEHNMGSWPMHGNGDGADLPLYGGGAEYWDSKHASDKNTYEWMQGYTDLSKVIAKCTNGDKEVRVLHVGCGSSVLTEDMYDDGYHNVVNIDISSIVIGRMRQRNKKTRPKMKWLIMDATAMKLEDAGFDVVLDKCTLDTLVTCKNSNTVVGKYLKEVARVLKRRAVFLAFSFGGPAVRMRHLKKAHLNFQVEVIKVPVPYTKSKFHFAYMCRKT